MRIKFNDEKYLSNLARKITVILPVLQRGTIIILVLYKVATLNIEQSLLLLQALYYKI